MNAGSKILGFSVLSIAIAGLVIGIVIYVKSTSGNENKPAGNKPGDKADPLPNTGGGSLPAPVTSKNASSKTPLKIGSKGWGVAFLQAAKNIGSKSGLVVDGDLGPMTAAALGYDKTKSYILPWGIGDSEFKDLMKSELTKSGKSKAEFISLVANTANNTKVNGLYTWGGSSPNHDTYYNLMVGAVNSGLAATEIVAPKGYNSADGGMNANFI